MAGKRVVGTKEAIRGFKDAIVTGWGVGYDAAVMMVEQLGAGAADDTTWIVKALRDLRPELEKRARQAAEEGAKEVL
jgi:hypothetical protein